MVWCSVGEGLVNITAMVAREKPSGAFGWFMIAAVATAYDLYAMKTKKVETLSSAYWRWSDHPVGGLLTSAVWAATSYHLIIDNPVRKLFKEST